MAISPTDLTALKARCHKALSTGFGVGHAELYAGELSAELGQKFTGKATTEQLVALISKVEAARSGKPGKPVAAAVEPEAKTHPRAAPAPEPEPEEEEVEDDDSDEESPVKKAAVARPAKKKKKR